MPGRSRKYVPKTEQGWQRAVSDANVIGKSLKGYSDIKSASKLTQEQVLLLRVLYEAHYLHNFDPSQFNLNVHITSAKQILGQSPEFMSYINAIRNNTGGGLRNFSEIRMEQAEILKSLQRTGNKLVDIDEACVNSSLISFLRSITAIATNNHTLEWRSSRISLVANFGRAQNNPKLRKYKATTDGQLQEILTGKIRAIVECKVNARERHQPLVDMQECAQMVT